jgi:hypothetical protein
MAHVRAGSHKMKVQAEGGVCGEDQRPSENKVKGNRRVGLKHGG